VATSSINFLTFDLIYFHAIQPTVKHLRRTHLYHLTMNQSVLYSEGDNRIVVGNRVEFVLVYMDPRTGVLRLILGVGDVMEAHTESVGPSENPTSPLYISRASAQFPFAERSPPALASDHGPASGVTVDQIRVTGFDIKVLTVIPWTTEDVPQYYQPKTLPNFHNVNHLYVPVRHVMRRVDQVSNNTNMIMSRFFRRAPYGWLVLYNEPVTAAGDPDEVDQALEQFYADRKSRITTRRVVGNVVDFGVDHDGVLKVVMSPVKAANAPKLDDYLFHGAFAEVARANSEEGHLYKLPYHWIHDAYDQAHLGEKSYYSMLKHVLCDTLSRFRVKTVKFQQNPKTKKTFYFGFTEEGFHFAKNGRHVLATEITNRMRSKPAEPEGYETRHTFDTHTWLNLREARPNEQIHSTVKRGYIIYGRLVERQDKGQTTLHWCTPSHGLDLLRVYLVTNGQSKIFRSLSNDELLEKLKDKDGNATLASKLFQGLVDPAAENEAINYIKQELLW